MIRVLYCLSAILSNELNNRRVISYFVLAAILHAWNLAPGNTDDKMTQKRYYSTVPKNIPYRED
jgi:hypothetical protein